MIELKNICYVYSGSTPSETAALKNVSLKIEEGKFYGLIGHTGSGKTTLVQLLSGLIKPTSGKILIDNINVSDKKVKLRDFPKRVGLVFQYPEYQLFEETVFADVAFGPKNLGCTEEEIKKRVENALFTVGLDSSIYDASPFELSGGQKRRVAIAGVISMEPDVLILDEPTAGLDPGGRDDILNEIKKLQKERGITVILVSHSMEDVARIADNVIVVCGGELKMCGSVREVFSHGEELEKMGLAIPQISSVILKLREKGIPIRQDVFTLSEAADEIAKLAQQKRGILND